MWEQVGEDRGIWTEYENTVTGERSLKTHTPRVVWRPCPQHIYDTYIPRSREITCLVCGQSRRIIVGKHLIRDDGVLIEVTKDR